MKCRRCGNDGEEYTLALKGEAVGTTIACLDCVNETEEEIVELRKFFDAMVASGMSEQKANERMIAMNENEFGDTHEQ